MTRKKKTLMYGFFGVAIIYTVLHIFHFNETYSPLRVLADAESEARRLLKFITLYHYQCNLTYQTGNWSHWPICLDKNAGVNLDVPKLIFSIGPSNDFSFEHLISQNTSSHLFLFSYEKVPQAFYRSNRTHIYKIAVVPNDPADFGRNSYTTQTINSLFESLKHPSIEILKIDHLFDVPHSHEILYYMEKDKLLQNVNQLHISLYIDKIDDDFLYSWYSTLYNLFHKSGFRLYHTSSSDTLCLQVTMMESCVYFMTWIKNPGPKAFIVYPPAIDGSQQFEEERLIKFVTTTQEKCPDIAPDPENFEMTLCSDYSYLYTNHTKKTLILRLPKSHDIKPIGKSEIYELAPQQMLFRPLQFQSSENAYKDLEFISLQSLILKMKGTKYSAVYLSVNEYLWNFITPLLDAGAFENVSQIIIDLVLWTGEEDKHPVSIRKRYSELKRFEAQGFHIFYSVPLEVASHYQNSPSAANCCFKLSLLNKM